MGILHSVIEELKTFFRQNNITSFQPAFETNKVSLEFELSVVSYVTPYKQENIFRFELVAWIGKEGKVECKITTKHGTNIPFHPHFEIKRHWRNGFAYYAEWVGYVQGKSTIYQQVEYMFHSLQYKRDYINVDNQIGNNEALLWFLKAYFKAPNRFAIGDHSPKKHFEVHSSGQSPEKKKFEVTQNNPQPKKKFTIHEEMKYKPAVQPLPEYKVEQGLNSSTDNVKSHSRIYISPTAREHIFSHIKWGDQHSTETKSEQGGLLLGKVYFDEAADQYYGIAEQGIPGRSAQGTATYLEMTHQTWKEMIDNVDNLLDREENKDLQIIGWYHTHPNQLPVFMSDTDMNTQQKYFNQKWHFAIVLNPQRQIWKAFIGAFSKECKGFFISTDSSSAKIEAASRAEIEEERQPVNPQPGEPGMNIKKVLLVLALVALVIMVFAKLTGFKKEQKTVAANPEKKTEKEKSESKPTPKAIMPNPTENKPVATELQKGIMILDGALEEVFKKPLVNPLKVTEQIRSDSTKDIEAHFFAYKDGVVVNQDSTLDISGKLRNTNSVNDKTLVGELIRTITISKGDYRVEGNWYKFKFVGIAKP